MKVFIPILSGLIITGYLPLMTTHTTQRKLQREYITALKNYEGTAYATPGYASGMSCSALVRQALIDVTEGDGMINFDAHLVNASFQILTHPCLANELRQSCNSQLSLVMNAANINGLSDDELDIGDIAVVGDPIGIHTLAYIGNKTWIHADPLTGKVIATQASLAHYYWFTLRVRVMRWNILRDTSNTTAKDDSQAQIYEKT